MSKKAVVSWITMAAMAIGMLGFPAAGYGASAAVGTPTVKAKAVSYKTIQLRWNQIPGASGYEIYRYSAAKKQYAGIKTLTNAATTSFKNTGLKGHKKYHYKIRAYQITDGVRQLGSFSKTVTVRTKRSDSQKLIAKARTKLGAAYSAGGAGPNSFDCSGYVYWVYKHAGVHPKKKVIRTSAAGLYQSLKKYKVGTKIKCAKPGDIILFTHGGGFSHAAIYIGHGKIIHAMTYGKGVRVQSVRQLDRSGTKIAEVIRDLRN